MTLMAFYRDYLTWIDSGAPVKNHWGFSRGCGLCDNMWWWTPNYEETMANIHLMRDSFENAGLDVRFPFDKGPWKFAIAMNRGEIYQNPKRIQWVRDQVRHGERSQKLFAIEK